MLINFLSVSKKNVATCSLKVWKEWIQLQWYQSPSRRDNMRPRTSFRTLCEVLVALSLSINNQWKTTAGKLHFYPWVGQNYSHKMGERRRFTHRDVLSTNSWAARGGERVDSSESVKIAAANSETPAPRVRHDPNKGSAKKDGTIFGVFTAISSRKYHLMPNVVTSGTLVQLQLFKLFACEGQPIRRKDEFRGPGSDK